MVKDVPIQYARRPSGCSVDLWCATTTFSHLHETCQLSCSLLTRIRAYNLLRMISFRIPCSMFELIVRRQALAAQVRHSLRLFIHQRKPVFRSCHA